MLPLETKRDVSPSPSRTAPPPSSQAGPLALILREELASAHKREAALTAEPERDTERAGIDSLRETRARIAALELGIAAVEHR